MDAKLNSATKEYPLNILLTDPATPKTRLGRVWIQQNYVVAYKYRELKEHENNYATHDLELAAIIHTLKMWWNYLIGRKFLLMSDNISLKYIFDQHNLNARQEDGSIS